jgi:hypothetical protein
MYYQSEYPENASESVSLSWAKRYQLLFGPILNLLKLSFSIIAAGLGLSESTHKDVSSANSFTFDIVTLVKLLI